MFMFFGDSFTQDHVKNSYLKEEGLGMDVNYTQKKQPPERGEER